MKNPSNKKEQGLIKGALRRVFSRSELRRKILDKSLVKDYSDPSRKRVTRWSKCPECKKMTPTYLMEVDHIENLIPLDKTLQDMEWTEVVDRLWCDERNLKAICEVCHDRKTKAENIERKRFKKEKSTNG